MYWKISYRYNYGGPQVFTDYYLVEAETEDLAWMKVRDYGVPKKKITFREASYISEVKFTGDNDVMLFLSLTDR